MKKIVPFNNILSFNTDVCEITAISLEHKIDTTKDAISGVFYISGEYKITDGQLENEKFNFELPFDIALGNDYNLDTLVVDIDDFRYELFERNKLKVHIDLYIDGEVLINSVKIDDIDDNLIDIKDNEENQEEKEECRVVEERNDESIQDKIDLLDITEDNNGDDNMPSNNTSNDNIFSGIDFEDNYVTYRVYRVLENDTIDKILEKYGISKEEFTKYNETLDIKAGDKLIIPANDK